MEYYYPLKDREQVAKRPDRLGAKLAEFASLKNFTADVSQFKAGLTNAS